MSTQKSAVANNEKLFPIFSKRLSTLDSTSYATAAQKLAAWCSVEKAYYSAARPKIVDILETARATLQRELPQAFAAGTVCQTGCPPDKVACVEGYVKLLRTAANFFHSFNEKDLQERLHALLLTVGIDSASLPVPVKKSTSPASSTPQRLRAPSTSTSPALLTSPSSADPEVPRVASHSIPLPPPATSIQAPVVLSSPVSSKPASTQAIHIPSNHASPTTPTTTLSSALFPHPAPPVQPASSQSIPEPAPRVAEAQSLPAPASRPETPPSIMPIVQGQPYRPNQPQPRSTSSTPLEPRGWTGLITSPVQALPPHAPMPHAMPATNPNINSTYTNNTRVTPTSTTSNVLVFSSSSAASSPVSAPAGGPMLPTRRVTLPTLPAAGPAAASSSAAGPSAAQTPSHLPPRSHSVTMPAPPVPSTSAPAASSSTAPAAPPPKKKKRTHAPLDFMALDLQSYLQDKERMSSAGTSTPTSPAFTEARAASAAATTPAPSASVSVEGASARPAAADVTENTISTAVPQPSTPVADLPAGSMPVASTSKAPSPVAAAPEVSTASASKATPEPSKMEVDTVSQSASVAPISTAAAAPTTTATSAADVASGPSMSTAAPAVPASSPSQVPGTPDVPNSAPTTEALPKEVTSRQRLFRSKSIARKSTSGRPPRPRYVIMGPPSAPVSSDSHSDSDSSHEKESDEEEQAAAAAPDIPAASPSKTTPEPSKMEVDAIPQHAFVASTSTAAAVPATATSAADAASGPSTSTAASAVPASSHDQVPATPDVPSSASATEVLPKEVTTGQRPFKRKQFAMKSTGGRPPRHITMGPPSAPASSDSHSDSDSSHEKESEKEKQKIEEEVQAQSPPKRVRATARKSTGIRYLPKSRSPQDTPGTRSPSRPKDASPATSATDKKPSPPKIRLKIKVPPPALPAMDSTTFAAELDKAVALSSPTRKPARKRKPPPAASPKNIESESPSPPPEAGASGASGASATPEASPMRDLRAEMRARRDAIGGGSARKKGRELKIFSREPSGGSVKAKTPVKAEAGGDDPFVVRAPAREEDRMDVDGVGSSRLGSRGTDKGKGPRTPAPVSALPASGGRVQAPPLQTVASADGSMDMDVDGSSASAELSVKGDRMADTSAARTSSRPPASAVRVGSNAEARPSTARRSAADSGPKQIHALVPTFEFTPSPVRNGFSTAPSASVNGPSGVAVNPRKRLRSRSRSPTDESSSSRRRSESLQTLPPPIRQPVDAAVPPIFSTRNGHFNPWLPVKDEEASDEEENYDELGSMFTSQMRVIDGSPGRAGSSTFSLRCALASAEFSLLSRWVKAKNNLEDVSQTMCISLACYSAQEMASTRASMGNPEAWEPVLKGCHPSDWPAYGILYANVNDKISLLLSKPLKVVDNLVDISYLMQEGQNTLQISHDQDTTDYVFFLIAHHPVRAQLKELASVRQEEIAWAQHIENSTKPLQSATKLWEHFMIY